MEERKAWEDFLKDPQRSYDAQCKKILSLKKILAYLYKECLSEYRHLSLKEIYDRLDTDPTSNKVVSQNVEENRITGRGETKQRGKDTMEVLILYPRRRY